MTVLRNHDLRACENHVAEAMIALRAAKLDRINYPEQQKIQVALGDALEWVQELSVKVEGAALGKAAE